LDRLRVRMNIILFFCKFSSERQKSNIEHFVVLLFLTTCSDCEYEILQTFCFVELIGLGVEQSRLDYVTACCYRDLLCVYRIESCTKTA